MLKHEGKVVVPIPSPLVSAGLSFILFLIALAINKGWQLPFGTRLF